LLSVEHLQPTAQVGRLVAARWQPDEHWYRARVLALTSQTSVRLLYIDYGDVAEVEWWKARRLPARFRRLAAQALPARLAGARPPAGGWGRTAGRALIHLAGNSEERGLLAVVGSTGGGDMLPVWLVDTTGNDVPEGVWLHERLVAQGLAEFQVAGETGLEAVVRPRVRALVREAVALAGELAGGREGESLRRRVLDIETRVRNLEGVVYSDDKKLEEPAAEEWTVERRVPAGPGCPDVAVVRGAGQAWVPAGAASGLVPEWRGWDLLEARLAVRGLRPESRRLARSDTSGWAALEAAGLLPSGRAELLLYRLDTLPPALATISQPAAAVLTAVWNNVKGAF
jgi:hypothetical protein